MNVLLEAICSLIVLVCRYFFVQRGHLFVNWAVLMLCVLCAACKKNSGEYTFVVHSFLLQQEQQNVKNP